MKQKYNFKDQKQLLDIALQICEDYKASEYSFGGGTLLSVAYYQHRMSYDIDIFTEDFLFIQNLIDNKLLIAQSLGIDEHNIEASPSAITFILSSNEAGLKLDFLYSEPITSKPYDYIDVLDQINLKVQTPQEVIARKIKYREILTVRDFVDFSYVQQNSNMMKELQKEIIDNVGIERYIEIVEQFTNMPIELLDTELKLFRYII
ncbi:MAG: nucleotidyl transferase AbiEii/AbiGii toxin family protein [Campylobacterota bacterium]|nr:nucleotidyl transferase AbiEii/AbiGii toxin family protein [Campylobacterota bacterium]